MPFLKTLNGYDIYDASAHSSITSLESTVSGHTSAINTLNGDATTAGSVAKQVADAVASLVNDAPAAYDTLKEISDWISSHSSSASSMNSAIQANTSAIAILNGNNTTAGSVAKAVKDEADARSAAISGIEDTIGVLPTGKTVAQAISDAQSAASYDDTALAARVTATESSISTLNGANTVNGSVAKAVKDASDAITATIGTVPANKTVVGMISEAQSAATYDDTALAARVTANEGNISTLQGKTVVLTVTEAGAGTLSFA